MQIFSVVQCKVGNAERLISCVLMQIFSVVQWGLPGDAVPTVVF